MANYVGGSKNYAYDNTNSIIEVTGNGGSLSVSVDGWNGRFYAMYTLSRLEVGYYPNLVRWPFHNPVFGGLSWSGNGRGNNTLSGWFVIDEISFDGVDVSSVTLRFEQRGGSGPGALHGFIRWNSDDDTEPNGPIDPIPMDLWQPSPSVNIPEAGTFVHLESESGDFIGQGLNYFYDPSNALIGVTSNASSISISVEDWDGNFDGMYNLNRLRVGYYPNLERSPFHNPAVGGLDWSGKGRGSNTLSGWFAIDEIPYVGLELKSFTLRFAQRSGSSSAALYGFVRWDKDDDTEPNGPVRSIPSELWTPGPDVDIPDDGTYIYLYSEPGDYVGQGLTYEYEENNTNILVDGNGGSLSVSVDGWNGDFVAMYTLNRLEVGYYPNLARWPFHNPALGGFNWSGKGRGNNRLTAWVIIDEITYEGVDVESVTLRFRQQGEGSDSGLYGFIRWVAPGADG